MNLYKLSTVNIVNKPINLSITIECHTPRLQQYWMTQPHLNIDQSNLAKGRIAPHLYSPGGSIGLTVWL